MRTTITRLILKACVATSLLDANCNALSLYLHLGWKFRIINIKQFSYDRIRVPVNLHLVDVTRCTREISYCKLSKRTMNENVSSKMTNSISQSCHQSNWDKYVGTAECKVLNVVRQQSNNEVKFLRKWV